MGNRIAKHVYNNQTLMLEKSTYYILDAQGNQLSMYDHKVNDGAVIYYLAERNIYGSSRLGTLQDTVNMFIPAILPSYGVVGNRNYELSNHLGNVLTVINDIVYPLSEDSNTIDGYEVGISNVFDYSPFGVMLDGRTMEKHFTPIFDTTFIDDVDSNYISDFDASSYSLATYDEWSASDTNNVSLGITGQLRLRVESTNSSEGTIHDFMTTPGHTYYISFNLDLGSTSSTHFAAYDIPNSGVPLQISSETITSSGDYTFTFTPNEAHIRLKIYQAGVFSIKDVTIMDSSWVTVDFTDLENPVYIAPSVDIWSYNPDKSKVYFENNEVHMSPSKTDTIIGNSFNNTNPSALTVDFTVAFENTHPIQKSMTLWLYTLNNSNQVIARNLIKTITSDGSYSESLPNVNGSKFALGWTTTKNAQIKLTDYTVWVLISWPPPFGTLVFDIQTGNFNSPQITKPSYDGWTINTKSQLLSKRDKSGSNRLLLRNGVHKYFTTVPNENYRFTANIDFLSNGGVIFSPLTDVDNTSNNNPQFDVTDNYFEIFSVSGGVETSIYSQIFTGSVQIQKDFEATTSQTKAAFLLGNITHMNKVYYVDNLKLAKLTKAMIYTSNFSLNTILAQDVDSWQADWETSYLNVTTSNPNKLRVSGENPKTIRTFNVSAGYNYELKYTQSQNNSVNLLIEQADNSMNWNTTLLNTPSSNGANTFNFTPTESNVRITLSAATSFALVDISLNGELHDTIIDGGYVVSNGYRYGFNGMERDDNVKGAGNSYTTEFRQYDPRVGRWLSIDPLFAHFPWQSPYVAFDNNPIYYNDPKGLAAEGGGRKNRKNRKNRKKKETGQEKEDGTFDGSQVTEEVEILSPKRTIWQKLKTIYNKVLNSYKNDTKIVRDYRNVNYVLKKAVEYLNSLFPPGEYSPYEDRNKNPYETNGGLHEISEDGQNGENHTVKFDLEKKNEPKTINVDVVVPGVDAMEKIYDFIFKDRNTGSASIGKGTGEGNTKTGHGGTPDGSVVLKNGRSSDIKSRPDSIWVTHIKANTMDQDTIFIPKEKEPYRVKSTKYRNENINLYE